VSNSRLAYKTTITISLRRDWIMFDYIAIDNSIALKIYTEAIVGGNN